MMRIGMMRNGFIAAGAALGLVATCAGAELRPPSVPVVSCDPFFSVWSPSEDPTLADTENWFGAKQPEKYANLRVRVSGFSGYFVKMRKEIQDEIIARTVTAVR